MNQSESLSDIERWVEDRLAGIGPAILGSLSLRRSPCIRENCVACLSGEQHPSYVLYGRAKGRRFSVYVPEELVPELSRTAVRLHTKAPAQRAHCPNSAAPGGAFVIAPNTAFTFKGKAVDVKKLGRELNVGYVLEGSVQRGGNRFRVNVQLIDAETGNHL
jgi:hypothetical protein